MRASLSFSMTTLCWAFFFFFPQQLSVIFFGFLFVCLLCLSTVVAGETPKSQGCGVFHLLRTCSTENSAGHIVGAWAIHVDKWTVSFVSCQGLPHPLEKCLRKSAWIQNDCGVVSVIKILELNERSLPSGTCPTNEPKEAVFKQPNVAFSPASL